jgi:hypothetical protein
MVAITASFTEHVTGIIVPRCRRGGEVDVNGREGGGESGPRDDFPDGSMTRATPPHASVGSTRLDDRLNAPDRTAPLRPLTRPVTIDGRRFNQGFLWSASSDLVPLRSKFYLPDEPGGWEARWFDRGDSDFPSTTSARARSALNICIEMWALETYSAYAARDGGLYDARRLRSGGRTGERGD